MVVVKVGRTKIMKQKAFIFLHSISSFMHIYQMEVTICCLCCTINCTKIVMITSNPFISKCVFFVACGRYFQLCLSESVQMFREWLLDYYTCSVPLLRYFDFFSYCTEYIYGPDGLQFWPFFYFLWEFLFYLSDFNKSGTEHAVLHVDCRYHSAIQT